MTIIAQQLAFGYLVSGQSARVKSYSTTRRINATTSVEIQENDVKILTRVMVVVGLGVVALSLVILTVGQGQSLLAPAGTPGETYFAAFPLTMALDGNLAAWDKVPHTKVSDGPHPSADPKEDGSVTFAAVADTMNLYVLFEVADTNIVSGKHGINYWNEDSVELYLNATGNLTLKAYAPGVAQITLPAANIGLAPDQTLISGINSETIGVKARGFNTATGYAIEVAVPLKTAEWNIEPVHGRQLGFQVELNGASKVDRDTKLSWSHFDPNDQSYQNPSVFGQLIFYKIGETEVPVSLPRNAPTPAPATQTLPMGSFSVHGSHISDPDGNEFIAKGVNVNGYNWVWPRETTQDADLITKCWKFNLVRVNSFLFTGQTKYQQYTTNNDLDKIVNTFTQRKVVVVIEAHDRIGSYYEGTDLTALVSWFTQLATRYKNNPYVWFDVMNEPGGKFLVDRTNWLNVHQQVIRAIRDDVGATNVIIVEGSHGGQDTGILGQQVVSDLDSAILQYAQDVLEFNNKTYTNVVFSIHTYEQWNFGDEKIANYFDRVLARGLALIVGEYGVDTGESTQMATQSMFNTAVPRHIGRIAWEWDGSDNNNLTTKKNQDGGGWQIDNCDSPHNLTWLGQKVWDDNHHP